MMRVNIDQHYLIAIKINHFLGLSENKAIWPSINTHIRKIAINNPKYI